MSQSAKDPSRDEYPDRRGEPPDPPYVVVRFTRPALPYDDDQEAARERFQRWRELGALWEKISREFEGIELRPLFRSMKPGQIREILAATPPLWLGRRRVQIFAYFQVLVPRGTSAAQLARRLRDSEFRNEVDTAYDEQIGLLPGINPAQFYLKAAPPSSATDWRGGVDALYAWGRGARGDNVRIIDIERGWFLKHEDFNQARLPGLLAGKIVRASALHGTQVLGVLYAQDGASDTNGVGVAPNTIVDCVSWVEQIDTTTCNPTTSNLANAIMFAACQLSPGDVLLIEASIAENELATSASQMFVPVEAQDACRDAIVQFGTLRNVTVVEAGGNGAAALDGSTTGATPLNMDTWTHPISGKRVLDARAGNPDYADCGAIMVGAAVVTYAAAPFRTAYSPLGCRVDCLAQGQALYTTTCVAGSSSDCSTDNYVSKYATPPFNGTSAAAAVVAGAVAIIQGVARASGSYVPPSTIRAMLKDPLFCTKVFTDGTGAQVAGYMPNLKGIIPAYLS